MKNKKKPESRISMRIKGSLKKEVKAKIKEVNKQVPEMKLNLSKVVTLGLIDFANEDIDFIRVNDKYIQK